MKDQHRGVAEGTIAVPEPEWWGSKEAKECEDIRETLAGLRRGGRPVGSGRSAGRNRSTVPGIVESRSCGQGRREAAARGRGWAETGAKRGKDHRGTCQSGARRLVRVNVAFPKQENYLVQRFPP